MEGSKPAACTIPPEEGPRQAIDLVSGETKLRLFHLAEVRPLAEVLAKTWLKRTTPYRHLPPRSPTADLVKH